MKKALLLVTISLFVFSTKAQVQDLSALSTGTNVSFTTIYDNDEKLYGYLALFYKGKATENTRNFEYVILDTNLNRVANKDFEAENTVMGYYAYINFKGELVMVPRADYDDYNIFNYGKIKHPVRRVVNLNTNEIKAQDSLCYDENDGFYECPENKEIREMQREMLKQRKESDDKTIYNSEVYELESGDFLLYETRYHFTMIGMVHTYHYYAFKKFDKDQNLVWEYEYRRPENMPRNTKQTADVFHLSDNYLYLLEKKSVKKNDTHELLKIDLTNGAITQKMVIDEILPSSIKSLQGMYSLRRHIQNKKSYDDKIYFIARDYDKKGKHIGFIRLTIDEVNNTFTFDKFPWTALEKYIKINRYGAVEKGYELYIRDAFMMEDGKVGMLFEKFKFSNNMLTGNIIPKATDMIFITTDAFFNVNNAMILKKDKSRKNTSDYMYSQYLNHNKDMVFFYRNYQKDEETKEKNWNLFINTVLNGNYHQEVIPISSEDNVIYPYIAKEGYILLREYNKDSKYNQIRLERLNF